MTGEALLGRERGQARRRGWLRRIVGIVLLVVAVLIAVPLVLVPVYAFVNPPSVPILVRYLTGQPVEQVWRPIDDISDRLKASVVLSEDGGFCRHPGVEFSALRDEIEKMLAGEEARGASTITMQVARNLFLWNDRSMLRKVLEIPLALYIDLILPKRRIMEIYLNIAEWGPNGQFGVEAGAMAAFGAHAEAMSWERAALLTTALPNPRLRLPGRPSAGLLRVAAIVETRARAYADRAGCLAANGALDVE